MRNKIFRATFLVPFSAVLLALAYLLSFLPHVKEDGGFNYELFGQTPVLHSGRIKPLDTVARTSLLLLSGKQTLKIDGAESARAMVWLTELMFSPAKTYGYKTFRIDHPEVLGLLRVEQSASPLYDFSTIEPHLGEIEQQARRASQIDEEKRSGFESAVLDLYRKISLYMRLQNSIHSATVTEAAAGLNFLAQKLNSAATMEQSARPSGEELLAQVKPVLDQYEAVEQSTEIRPVYSEAESRSDNNWITTAQSLRQTLRNGKVDPILVAWAELSDAFREGQAQRFNDKLHSLSALLEQRTPKDLSQAHNEVLFNQFEPFYKSMLLYVVVLLLCFAYWLLKKETLNVTAFAIFVVAFLLHSSGLISRVILQGRPPVTNLYSSAVFVGWGAVLLGVMLEWRYRRTVFSSLASAIGFITLIIAHHLSLDGDTMEMMRAVLDSNFWLATHVVTITIGYSATFLAGAIGILYLVRRAFDRSFIPEKGAALELENVLYGVLCFSAFFSFIGTVLGGIWADQSWGRFWGWDPKENGALLIVLWVMFMLHARANRIVVGKALMAMAIFGNVITAMAWFGVNMLNIGLHSYGYTAKAFTWLLVFTISQLIIMALALLPGRAPASKSMLSQRG